MAIAGTFKRLGGKIGFALHAGRASHRIVAALLIAGGLALEFTSGCGVSQPTRRASPPPPGVNIVGYVAGWEPFTRIDTANLSTVNFAFAHIRDGQAVLDQDNAISRLENVRLLRAGSPWLRVLVSIGGWGADGFSDAALTETSRARFAASVAAMVDHSVVDGVDIDWEYPGLAGPGIVHREEDRENFPLLLAAIRQALDALPPRPFFRPKNNHYLITAALADGEFVGHIDLARVVDRLDWVNLMTYDFHNSLTPTTGHHSALSVSATAGPNERSVERAVGQFLAAGVPARKLVLGVPFYGRAFAGVRDANHGLDQPYAKYEGDHPWPQLVADFIGRNGYSRYWDERAQAPYLWNAQTATFVSYDDPQSLVLKAQFVRSHGLGGIMFWEQSQDPNGELVGALAAALRNGEASDSARR
jgi:chitinase